MGGGRQAGEVGGSVAVVVGEGVAESELESGGFQAGEELLRAGDAAEGGDWAVDFRDFHGAAQAPDRALPTPGF